MRLASLLLLAPLLAAQGIRAADDPRPSDLNKIVSDYREAQLKNDPEVASALGDPRYDNQLSDYSVHGFNATLDRGRSFIDRLGTIDTTSLSDQQRHTRDALVSKLVQEQADAESKPWELPVTAASGFYLDLPLLVPELRFDTQADYEHYIERLKLVPTAFEQITTNLMSAIDDNRVLPKDQIDKIIEHANAIAAQKPEDSIFAMPLKKFPKSVSPADQASDKQEVLNAITRRVLPSYARFVKFLQTQYAAHAGAASPSQAYSAEQTTVITERARAEQLLGTKFDIKAYRETVLAVDDQPLDKRIAAWIQQQAK